MKTARFSDAQIMGIVMQAKGGVPVSGLCREHGMSSASFCKWRTKFGGMDASLVVEMKDLAEQNRQLKKVYAEMSKQNDSLKEALGKKIAKPIPAQGDGRPSGRRARDQHRAGLPDLPDQRELLSL